MNMNVTMLTTNSRAALASAIEASKDAEAKLADAREAAEAASGPPRRCPRRTRETSLR